MSNYEIASTFWQKDDDLWLCFRGDQAFKANSVQEALTLWAAYMDNVWLAYCQTTVAKELQNELFIEMIYKDGNELEDTYRDEVANFHNLITEAV